MKKLDTLQETTISHLGKRKIIFKYALLGGYVSSLEGTTKSIDLKLEILDVDVHHLTCSNFCACER